MALTLKAEDRVGHYLVVSLLGAGGMGEVYRARDQSLARDVALKILPPEVVTNQERVRRFTQEAKSASSLNHPHIVHIYEIGEDEARGAGPTSVPLHYIAMELVSGETLSAKIHNKRVDLKALLGWLAQAAEGVAKAHAAGIVHRDLKPGNIMISDDGYAKVLDFGLAKLMEHSESEPASSTAPTRTRDATREGTVLGTVGYMAPEQVRGLPLDARSDVFAFGCMIYEAATRRLAFAADSEVETLHRILHDEPIRIEQLNPKAPMELGRLIRRCLAKDPNQRLDSMRTVALELRDIVNESDEPANSSPSVTLNLASRKHRRVLGGALVAGTLLVAATVILLKASNAPPRLNPDLRTRAIETPFSDIDYPGLSADGHWIALPARNERGISGLYYMNASGSQIHPIFEDSTGDVSYADISPDGSQIAYTEGSGVEAALRVIPALGGASRTLSQVGLGPRWSPDGSLIGYIVPYFLSSLHRMEFWTVRPDGSDRERAFVDSTSVIGPSWGFAWAPDSKRIAWVKNFGYANSNEIVIHDLHTGRERQITHDRKMIDEVVWTPKNEIIFSSNRDGATNLWIMRASGGPPTQLTRGPGPDEGVRASADGRTLLYLVRQPLAKVGWWNVDTGEHGRVTREDRPLFYPIFPSPDGRRIAVRFYEPDAISRTGKLVVMNRDGSGERTLVAANANPQSFDWSADGLRLAWVTSRGDSVDLHIMDVGTGETLISRQVQVPGGLTNGLNWLDEDTIKLIGREGSFDYSISSKRITSRSPHRAYTWPSRVPGWTVLLRQPDTATQPGIYVRPTTGGAERLVMPYGWMCSNPALTDFLYCWPESLGFRRLQLPSGQLKPVSFGPPEGRAAFYPTHDGRVVYWMKVHLASKLVLVENLH